MDSIKCSQCGLINVSTEALCERCGATLIDTDKSNEVSQAPGTISQIRVAKLQCVSCGERLEVAPDMSRFACAQCGTEQIVERKGGTVALKRVAESISPAQAETKRTTTKLALARFQTEIENSVSAHHPQAAKVNTSNKKVLWILVAFLALVTLPFLRNFNSASHDSGKAALTGRYSAVDQTTKTNNKTTHQTGEQFLIGYMRYEVNSSWYTKQLSSNEYLNQQPDATYLFVDLDVWNEDKEERAIPPFKLVDENNAEYGTSNKAWASERSIGLIENLNPGVGKRGYVIFDVPTSHTYKLKVSGGYWSGEEAYIALSPNSSRSSGKR